MTPKELDKLLLRYTEGKCTAEELDFIESWYSSLEKMPAALSHEDEDTARKLSSAESRILGNLHRHTQVPEPARRHNVRSLSWYYYTGIAASLLIFASVVYYNFFLPDTAPAGIAQPLAQEFTQEENPAQAPKRVVLPDGSIVVMAGKSKIAFSGNSKTGSRELFLEGEAYFDIAHNPSRPFYVYAGNVITRVVGTSFVVCNRGNKDVTVSVKTGKVTVCSKKAMHKKTVLTSSQKAVYDPATDLVTTQHDMVSFQKDALVSRYLNEMNFDETPVPEVFDLLTKTYHIDIRYNREILAGCVLTSSFYEEGLYDRIDVICTAIGATYKIADAQIIIESNGCNLKPNEP